jgi:ATP-dependent Lhr-like helicase
MNEYEPQWLDEHCRAGRIIWTRLAAGGGAAPIRSTPIVLLARRNAAHWATCADATAAVTLSANAQATVDFIRAQGASFFDEIAEGAGLLPAQAEEALAELVAAGMVNSDSFAGLRVLLTPSGRRGGRSSSYAARHKRRLALFGMADAGRWAIVRRQGANTAQRSDEAVEQIVRALLRRWGVIFWKLLAREADWLPPWRDILACCRRLEARGEIRGGRFVEGLVGEQFALPEVIAPLRAARKRADANELVCLSGCDPLNLVGTVLVGDKVPALSGSRVLYRDGMAIAALIAGKVMPLIELPGAELQQAQHALLRHALPLTDSMAAQQQQQ